MHNFLFERESSYFFFLRVDSISFESGQYILNITFVKGTIFSLIGFLDGRVYLVRAYIGLKYIFIGFLSWNVIY